MITYLPPAYPDELLYSLLARYCRHTGAFSPKRTLEVLFDKRDVRAGVGLQAGLGALSRLLPVERQMSPEELAREFTLFPYLTSFQPECVRSAVQKALTESTAGWINVRLGLAASTVRPFSALRYCPACRAEMMARQGELYWRRAHQLPGVLVCPLHRMPLVDSTARPALIGQHEFMAADDATCPVGAEPPAWAHDQCLLDVLMQIAVSSVELLEVPPPAQSFAAWSAHYRALLGERGFAKGRFNIAQTRLANCFAAHFGRVMDLLGGPPVSEWLAAMGRKHRRAFHPLHHVLIGLLLETRPAVPDLLPFGLGPWRCRNPLAKHFGQRKVVQLEVHRLDDRSIGRFTCQCGYVFSVAAGAGARPRVLERGPLFEQNLRRLTGAGAGLRAAARDLHVDTGTVRRYTTKWGLDVPWKPSAVRPGAMEPRVDKSPVAQLAGLARRPHGQPRQHGPRRDWPAADRGMVERLKVEAAEIAAASPPVRVTRAELERHLGTPGWFIHRLSKLPASATALENLQESLSHFQIRRIAWAASELSRWGDPCRAWRLRRLAGLPKKAMPVVEAALDAYERDGGKPSL